MQGFPRSRVYLSGAGARVTDWSLRLASLSLNTPAPAPILRLRRSYIYLILAEKVLLRFLS
jgi:hypothetical protein